MKLLLHITTFVESDATRAKDWLYKNGWPVDDNDWLDCTMLFSLFDPSPDKIGNFCLMVCEATSVDMYFDEWKITQ